MTYTRVQLEEMTDETLERKARQLSNEDSHFWPCTASNHSYILQDRALFVDSIKYIEALDHVMKPIIRHSSTWHTEYAALLFNATPRQRTIAAILALQGGTGDE
ncbi:hypothetical protein [Paenibacillus dendritiformis]|uniref:hypothetical protein n=1 Tax=Paenibacillus dendritiformis TaxID=130049 RepID=UPI000DA96C1B|nr:hypothetical protein [Paenibacillus dendritiformis]PZM63483.1 hypothetical protein DOE73_21830 [Paenibacillus dendritiformis]